MGQLVLGMAYKEGKGAPQNETKAESLFKKALSQAQPAADTGNVRAQLVLGRLYEEGWVLPREGSNACSWYEKAADQGYAPAQFHLGGMYHKGYSCGSTRLYTSDAVSNMYTSLYRKAADQGYAPAEFMTGQLLGVQSQFEYAPEKKTSLLNDSLAWHHKAAEHDYSYAQYCLGEIYDDNIAHKGVGVTKSSETAIAWYCKAAKNKHAGIYKDAMAKCPKEKKMLVAKQRATRLSVDKMKHSKKFTSYNEAQKFFNGALSGSDGWSFETKQGDKFDRLVYVNPQHYKGKIIETLLLVQQAVDKKTLLLKPIIYDADTVKTYYGVISPNFPSPSGFVDDKSYAVIAEVQGTADYVDVRGFTRTVPKLFIYAISPYPFKTK